VTQAGLFEEVFYTFGFIRDPKQYTYHARQDCWQQIGGYNNIYDEGFRLASDMERGKFPFTYKKKDYVFWVWKGDYLNLGAGAELGIYERKVVEGIKTPQWDVKRKHSMTMGLTLKSNKSGNTIFTYNPDEDHWWITGFQPYLQNIKAKDLKAIFTITFVKKDGTKKKGMFNKFHKRYKMNERWTFNTDKLTATLEF
jgi:hypothetical protein